MKFPQLSILTITILGSFICSCSGGKTTASSNEKANEKMVVQQVQPPFKYRFVFGSLGSLTKHHDNIWIDTTGQMIFDTEQKFKDGKWKSPRGIAFLEPKDEDTLRSFIKQDALFSIEQSDVQPQCPNGDQYILRIFRSDLNKELVLTTNTCASEYNLLSGQQRKVFPALLGFIDRIRERYRPLFTE